MAWFRNHYECPVCSTGWEGEWSCMVDDECPECGADIQPDDSEDLTYSIRLVGDLWEVWVSPATAQHRPEYEWKASLRTKGEAEEWAAHHAEDHEDAP